MLLAVGCVASLSCRPRAGGSAAAPAAAWVAEVVPDLGEVVARVGSNPIFAEEVRAQAQRTGKPARDALQDLVSFHLLAERARERGVASAEVPRGLLVERFVVREFEPTVELGDLQDVELRAIYQKFKTRYVHPRVVRVALLSVYVRRGKPREVALARARDTARDLFKYVGTRSDRTPDDFGKIAQEPEWSARHVAFVRIWQGPDSSSGPLDAPQGAAIARLRKPGDTTGLMEAEGAYHIARYIEEMAAENVPFEQARAELFQEYYPRWRRDRFERFAGRLAEEHRIEVFGDRVSRMARAPRASAP